MMDSKQIGDALVVLIVAGKGIYDVFGGKRRDKRHTAALDGRFATLELSLEQKFGEVRAAVAEVRTFCIGPDGENGFRSDIRRVEKRVIGLEERERSDLERRVGALDRRSGV